MRSQPSRLALGGISLLLAFRLAFKGLRRDPGTSSLAVLILALGLAAPAVFFSLLVGASRPLPVPHGRDIVRVDVVQPTADASPLPVGYRDVETLQAAGAVSGIGGFEPIEATLVDPGVGAIEVAAAALTPQVFPLLGVEPALGRIPGDADARSALIIGWSTWQELYEGDPAALGRSVIFGGELRTITAVMPDGFGFPFNQSAWVVSGDRDAGSLQLVARLSERSAVAGAQAELMGRWAAGDPDRGADRRGVVVLVAPYTEGRGEGRETIAFLGLTLIALSLLLIACANVANLLLVRAFARVRALGIQSALGASRAQTSAQLLLEALLVSLAGGAVGLLLAWGVIDLIQRNLAAEHFGYFWMRMAVDGTVFAFIGVLLVVTAAVAGFLPILQTQGVDVQRVLKEEAGTGSMGGGGAWSRGFVTTQLALSCAALVAAGLTGRSLMSARDFGRGVPAAEILLGGGSGSARLR